VCATLWVMSDERNGTGGARTPWVWAKSRMDQHGRVTEWLPLHEHLADSADAAELLWDRWLGDQRRAVIASGVGGVQDARRLAIFLAGVHDVGKATPPFAVKVPELAELMRYHGFPLTLAPTREDQRRLPHGLAGQVILERYLQRRGWGRFAASQLGSVVGGHHGVPPGLTELEHARSRDYLLGDDAWLEAQEELIDAAVRRSGVDLDLLRDRGFGTPALVLLTGLVIVADWLASDAELFPLAHPESQLRSRHGRAQRAWERIRLPEPWVARDEGDSADELAAVRFGLTGGARPVQAAAIELARRCDVPGIMVIEAPMGEGKTEAALLAAEILAARSGASGIVDALPTQATTNAMFTRVLSWLGRVPDASVAEEAQHAVALAHGKARLDPAFRRLRAVSRARGIGIDEELQSVDRSRRQTGSSIDAFVHHWMTSRKKTPLADFLVATVDQVLFLALQARHLALRHLGLAGKVVIIDEVHAYDAYMSVYLHRALEWLGAYGCPVVLLSATLPSGARSRLVEAYQRGVEAMRPTVPDVEPVEAMFPVWTQPEPSREPGPEEELAPAHPQSSAYPVVWSVMDGVAKGEGVPASGRGAHVEVELAPDDAASLDAILDEALVEGGCVLVIRNTVQRAQETYRHLVGRFGDGDVTLAHSRFMACDRAGLDAGLVRRFGPPSGDPGEGTRPWRHVVVATQVVEQSLDVDFDLLVTDLAPADLVLQRIGRLHRHPRSRPPRLESPRCFIVGVRDWRAEPPVPDEGSQKVYGSWALLQAAALLLERSHEGGVIEIPEDIAPWVEQAYGSVDLGPASWGSALGDARKEHEAKVIVKESAATVFRLGEPMAGMEPLTNWLGRSAGDADESVKGSAQVRDTEDSIEVLLLARDEHAAVRIPEWIDDDLHGHPIPMDVEPDAAFADAIASCALRLPAAASRGARGDAVIAALDKWYVEAWQRSPLLRGQLVMVLDEQPDGSLSGDVGGQRFTYDQRHGLKVGA